MVNYADQFDAKVVAMETDDVEYSARYKQSLVDIDSTFNNASTEERESKIKSFEIASKKERTYIAAETRSSGMYVTAAVGGRIMFRFLTKSVDGHDTSVEAEIAIRKIQYNSPLAGMAWYPKLAILKMNELGELAKQPGGAMIANKAMTVKDVKDFVPQSPELRALLDNQKTWLANGKKHQ